MKGRLANKDIEGSLSFFTQRKREVYRNIFTTIAARLPVMLQEMGDSRLVEVYGDAAIYDLRTVRGGVEYSFQLLFIRNKEGIWQIDAF